MFNHLFNKTPQAFGETEMVYTNPVINTEQKEMERIFTRLFHTDDGKKALAYLQVMTFQRAHGPMASDEQLRYAEGQRSMVATILRMIDRGKNG